ncbi:ATP-binding protein [Alicyclobacillus vulcanalis]|uniref:histidine kinase n=1 Tax=Alicyclobacillus vulcanalis TaxID=252246 RepID=A0A1N7KKI5_9BACL|nr:ATP-binding protein [Alicyclobacillus vulcanalis]SIS62131.1 two-component system, OmpR family, sensor histidine kinase ResE [Alicyclobacillus vulcanalis]
MIPNSIVAKMWLTIVGMVFVIQALLSVLLQQVFNKYVVTREEASLTQLALTIESVLATGADSSVKEQVASDIAKRVEHATVVYGIPYTKSPALKAAYDALNESQRRMLDQGEPVIVAGSPGRTRRLSVYVKIPTATSTAPGMLAVSQDTSVLDEPLREIRNMVLFDTVLGVILATGFAFVISKNLSRPLVDMTRAAEEMARGHYRQRVRVVTRDEVGRLGHTFNALARQLAETIEQLSMEREGLQRILSSLQDGVVATDLDGRVVLANPPAKRHLRHLSVAERGIVDEEKLPDRLMSLWVRVREQQDAVYREDTWDGRTIAITMLPLYEADGTTLRGALCVLRDITEERRLDRLRKDFIANVSHELRTPLSMLQGYTEALLDDISDDPEMRRELTEIIHDETLRMKRLVNDLLNLAQLESGQFKLNFVLIDLTQVMRRVARKFQALAGDGEQLAFHVSISNGPVLVEGDEDRLEQVFTNLLDNAFRHTSQGTIQFELDIRHNYAYVRVADTGSGIPEEDVPYIFERFYKADKARTRTRSGTGLGLAIARQLVIEHRGEILVESRLGEGTTFTVVLPLASEVHRAEGGNVS